MRNSRLIAHIERLRHRRQYSRSPAKRALRTVAIAGLSIGIGIGAYSVGQGVGESELTLPIGVIQAVTTVLGLVVLANATRRAAVTFEQLAIDHLFTTVRTREIVLGVVGFLLTQYTLLLALPVSSLATGFALGVGAPGMVVSIVGAGGALLTLLVVGGSTLGLAKLHLKRRSVLFTRLYSIVLYGLPVLAWFVVTSSSLSGEVLFTVLGGSRSRGSSIWPWSGMPPSVGAWVVASA
ncbi:hypothetical protein [Halovivax asiaticus]|uniref:hypothetical protein n=1 Tax=Halovivax asiaticus TaxID=332953 RepID=UPI0012670E86|nr:hypothetical protein [Halovivax asiaticus]